jgi:hypothetical protein
MIKQFPNYSRSIFKSITFSILAFSLYTCAGDPSVDDNSISESLDIQLELDVEENQFNITQNSDTIVFGEAGTVIYIPENSFQNASGQPVDEVEISLKEYYDLSDILAQDLSTIAEKGILETGGMIHLKAKSNEKEVFLKPNNELIIHFPKNGNTAEMSLFSQSFSDSPGNIVKWKEEKSIYGHEIDTLTPFIMKYDDLDSDTMLLTDGTNIWDWLKDEITLTTKERDYVRLRDFNIDFLVTKAGEVTEVALEKGYDKKKCKRLLKIIKNMPDLIPFRRSGEVIDMESWVNFAVKYIPAKHLSNADYLLEIENKYPEFEKKSINDIDQVELNYYIFNTAKLGWLNCDHFVDDPAPKVDMSLTLDEPENLMIKFVFKDLKSVITPTYEDGTNHFKGIPEGKDIALIVIKSEKNKVQMSITEHVTASGALEGISFQEYTLGELKAELLKLN